MRKLITLLIKAVPLLALVLSFTLASAQIRYSDAPAGPSDFTISVLNFQQTAPNKIDFDVYLLDTDAADDFELASVQFGFLINHDVYNGGTVTGTINNTGSGLLAVQQFTAAVSLGYPLTGYPNVAVVRLAGKVPPGAGNGTIISKVAPGT